MNIKVTHHCIDLRGGRLRYGERGHGPPTLFIHGIFAYEYSWNRYVESVALERRCLIVDVTKNPLNWIDNTCLIVSLGHQALLLQQLIDTLEIAHIDLVTNDSATLIARSFAAANPQRIGSFMRTNGLCFPAWSGR